MIMSCVESEKESADTLEKQKNKQDDRPAVVLVVRHATPGSDLQCSDRTGAVRAPTAAF